MPWVIAESVCREVSDFLDIQLPSRYAMWLDAKADLCFQKNPRFRRQMRYRGNTPRDLLWRYMRHWLSALLGTERRDLWYCLPPEFDLGHPLPRGEHGRWNRRNRLPLPPPRRWKPELVLTHRNWQWLATNDVASKYRRSTWTLCT